MDEEPSKKEIHWRNYSPALWSWCSFETKSIFKIIPYLKKSILQKLLPHLVTEGRNGYEG